MINNSNKIYVRSQALYIIMVQFSIINIQHLHYPLTVRNFFYLFLFIKNKKKIKIICKITMLKDLVSQPDLNHKKQGLIIG